jgi:hypothetical protein
MLISLVVSRFPEFTYVVLLVNSQKPVGEIFFEKKLVC